MAPQRLEEGLEAAVNQASQQATVDLHIAYPLGLRDLCRWGATDERHRNSLNH